MHSVNYCSWYSLHYHTASLVQQVVDSILLAMFSKYLTKQFVPFYRLNY